MPQIITDMLNIGVVLVLCIDRRRFDHMPSSGSPILYGSSERNNENRCSHHQEARRKPRQETASTASCSSMGNAERQITNAPTTKPLCIGCSRGLNLFHLTGKYQRGPSTSKDALSCDQSDGHEQSWLLPGMFFVLYRKSEKRFMELEDVFHVIIHPKPITPLRESLQDSLLNSPFNFNFNSKYKYKFKDR
ncbi:hypothetical protein BTUL_0172g00180 [Botrytis tulipae]|uniref:Uncharacterized protein n=1 Tax=Botrytis tulipae TaxID=87230 RepID=A0A4Z1EAQ4_9HELO|nr:hypothetical protein BTUL_0172g00180 [Botrytis tulipae]